MLFLYPYLNRHPAVKLNQHLIYFFRKLRNVQRKDSFEPISGYFHTDFVDHLNASPVLKQKFEAFFNHFKRLSNANKSAVLKIFFEIQNIERIIEDDGIDANQYKYQKLPQSIRGITKTLFNHMYPSTLDSIGNLLDHYRTTYNDVFEIRNLKVCPFCGIEPLYPPSIRRQDYDHILKQETYLFASLNMRNLVPMGRDCNQVFKNRRDSIYNNGIRRSFANPFKTYFPITISLNGSTLPNRRTSMYGTWLIDISPANKYTRTWNEVFDIKKRYSKLMLERYFDDWIQYFVENKKRHHATISTHQQLITSFAEEAVFYLQNPYIEANIIKGALFNFLASCNDLIYYSAMITRLNS